MLETLLLAAIVAAPVGSASLFLPGRRRTRKAGAWSAIRRLVLAGGGNGILAPGVGGGRTVPRARGVGGGAKAARGVPVNLVRRVGGWGVREPDLAAGDAAVER